MKKQKLISLFLFITLFAPSLLLAHQPRITESRLTEVVSPEISKAYYAELKGEADVYVVEAKDAFDLYVGILVPDIKNTKKDVKAEIRKGDEVMATIGGENAEWKNFFEPFGQSRYWDGGEYKTRAEAGSYSIVVTSTNNDSKYSLAIGEIEAFDRKEGVNALSIIPELKRDFFEESPIGFIKSPFGWGLIVVMYLLAGVFGFIYRTILKKFSKNSSNGLNKNIGKGGRVIRLLIGLVLLLWAISTTWSSVLIFLSGLAVFEAVFSWCALNHLMGKNTCEIE